MWVPHKFPNKSWEAVGHGCRYDLRLAICTTAVPHSFPTAFQHQIIAPIQFDVTSNKHGVFPVLSVAWSFMDVPCLHENICCVQVVQRGYDENHFTKENW